MATVEDRVKAWAWPTLMAIAAGLALMLWNNQQGIIAGLQQRLVAMEVEQGNSRATLAIIAENQDNSREECQDFQKGVTQRLDRVEDVLTQVGQSLAALAAIQERQERQIGR